MEKNTNGLVKPVEKNGKVLTHRDTSIMGVSQYYSSTFIRNKNVLVKGEHSNIHSHKRNAMIILLDGQTEEIISESSMSITS